MKKESFKNLILVLLVISSISLTVNMWLKKKLWPEGYNFFSNITNLFNKDSNSNKYFLSKENISYPTKIVITNIEKRSIYTHTENEFDLVVESIMPIIKNGMRQSAYSVSSVAEWETSLKGSSVFISYPAEYEFNLFNTILGVEPQKNAQIKTVKEFLIVPDYKSNNVAFFIKDTNNMSVYKTSFAISNNLADVITNYSKSDVASLPFSFELNFDKNENTSVKQRILIEPSVTIPLESSYARIIYNNSLQSSIFDDIALKQTILSHFGVNTSSAKRYRDTLGTIVYVDNYGTIKFYKNGTLQYKAFDDTKGIKLTDSENDTYSSFIAGVEFINGLITASSANINYDINLSSYADNAKNNTISLALDYYIDGNEIIYNAKDDKQNINHAITLQIKNGRLIEYTQMYSKMRISDETVTCVNAIEALDVLLSDNAKESGTVNNLYIGYVKSDNSAEYLPRWIAKTSDGKTYIVGEK